jgi:hypothetical protein
MMWIVEKRIASTGNEKRMEQLGDDTDGEGLLNLYSKLPEATRSVKDYSTA